MNENIYLFISNNQIEKIKYKFYNKNFFFEIKNNINCLICKCEHIYNSFYLQIYILNNNYYINI